MEPRSETLKSQLVPKNPAGVARPRNLTSQSLFKYYIHDSVDACRLQLFGQLGAIEVEELAGCWRTVKTTVGNRKLVLDVRGLTALDQTGRQWLVSMTEEGASFLPEWFPDRGFRLENLAEPTARKPLTALRLLDRVLLALRGVRVGSAESPTQAQ